MCPRFQLALSGDFRHTCTTTTGQEEQPISEIHQVVAAILTLFTHGQIIASRISFTDSKGPSRDCTVRKGMISAIAETRENWRCTKRPAPSSSQTTTFTRSIVVFAHLSLGSLTKLYAHRAAGLVAVRYCRALSVSGDWRKWGLIGLKVEQGANVGMWAIRSCALICLTG